GAQIHDGATLSGATGTATGTVTYKYFTNSLCTLPVGGTTVAAPVTVTNATVPNSANVTFNAAGHFWWQATYSGDANNAGLTSPCNEELVVAKASPTLRTTLSGGGKSGASIAVPTGTAVNDTAALSGATTNATGTVTYTV